MILKKNILFVINNLNVGGAEKALVSLLTELDYTKYEVDLLLFKKVGLFLKEVPKEVNILPPPKYYKYFDCSFVEVLKTLNAGLIYNRFKFSQVVRKANNAAEAEQFSWKYLKNTMPKLKKKYDFAIGYLEKNPTYFVIDRVDAVEKIGYVHNDYVQLGLNKRLDNLYFHKLDKVITVSAECLLVLKQEFPHFKSKFHLVNNTLSKVQILKRANEPILNDNWDKNSFIILSVGRLEEQKNYTLAIKSINMLHEQGIDFKYFILGAGSLEHSLKTLVKELRLEKRVYFLGMDTNPYKYIQNADVILQTSKFEGKSIVIDEAKELCKIIILTNYPTAKDQIVNGETGLIAGMNASSIAEQLILIKLDDVLQQHLRKNLKEESKAGNSGLKEFLRLIE